MPATQLRAHLSDQEVLRREHAQPTARRAQPTARRTLSDPAATARALAWAICEIEAGLRSASWSGSATLACGRRSPTGSSGPGDHRSAAPVSCTSSIRSSSRAGGCGGGHPPGQRITFFALRLEAVPGRWELTELLY
jgi:hypothetical protein